MPTVQTTISISIPEDGMRLAQLETALAAAARSIPEVYQKLLLKAAQAMEGHPVPAPTNSAP